MEEMVNSGDLTTPAGDGVSAGIEVDDQRNDHVMEVDDFEPAAAAADDDAVPGPSRVSVPLDLYPAAHELPPRPPPANECNYTHYYALDVGKQYHDQYVFRHHNGLCVIGIASTHAAFMIDTEISGVDYNVGKTSRAEIKAVGKRKKGVGLLPSSVNRMCRTSIGFHRCAHMNAQVLESNSVLCKVLAGETFFLIRCCVRGTLLEVNERLIKEPRLIIQRPDTEGYIAIMMPRPEDWRKAEATLLTREQYRERRQIPAP